MSDTSTTQPQPLALNDVLGCVAQFIELAASSTGLPPFKPEQIIRGWQSLVVPPSAPEYCIVSLVSSVREGTNAYVYDGDSAVVDPDSGRILGSADMYKFVRHTVQVDFLGSTSQVPIELTRRRANIVETIANSTEASRIFKSINPLITCLYAEDVQSMTEMDDGQSIRHRHMLTLYIGENINASLPQEYIDHVLVKTHFSDRST